MTNIFDRYDIHLQFTYMSHLSLGDFVCRVEIHCIHSGVTPLERDGNCADVSTCFDNYLEFNLLFHNLSNLQ